jgi:hypothetical protein
MNKKILAAAIGAAMVAPMAAQADLKISGRVAGEFVSDDGFLHFQDNGNSRIQFDISDESGWYARHAMDIRLGRNQGFYTAYSNFPTVRDQYVGVKGDWGSFQFGRMAGSGKNVENDPFIGTFMELRNNAILGGGSGYGSSGFVTGVVQYENKIGDAKINLQYGPQSTTGLPTFIPVVNGGHIGATVSGKVGGAYLFGSYNNRGNTTNTYKLGGDFSFGAIKAKAMYEDTNGTNRYNLGGEFSMGEGRIIDVTYSDKGRDNVNAYYRLGYYQKITKKAHWWVGFTQNGNRAGDVASYGAGARVDM